AGGPDGGAGAAAERGGAPAEPGRVPGEAETGGARGDTQGDLPRAGGPALRPAPRGAAAGGLGGRPPGRGGGGGATEATAQPPESCGTGSAGLVGSAPGPLPAPHPPFCRTTSRVQRTVGSVVPVFAFTRRVTAAPPQLPFGQTASAAGPGRRS